MQYLHVSKMFQIHVTVRLHTKKETKCSVIKVITIKTNTSYNLSKSS